VGVVVAIVLALGVGGLVQMSSQSEGYDAHADRTLAAQGRVVAEQSNATAASVRALLGGVGGQTRQGLQVALDSAVQATQSESTRAAFVSSSDPVGGISSSFAAVFADRARSMEDLRAAFDDFLGMQSLPVAGAPAGRSGAAPAGASLLSASQATARISAAGALLGQADALYRSVRHSLAVSAGHGRLPRSVWVTDPSLWGAAGAASTVDLVSGSPTLAATHDVVIRTVRLTPPALPTAPGAAGGISVLSPVHQLGVTVVLANQGSVAEPRVVVRFELAAQSGGSTQAHDVMTQLALGGSVTLPTVSFPVKPGTTYVLTVTVIPPPAQTLTDGTVFQQAIEVAPAT
jgi:hypothetical protein